MSFYLSRIFELLFMPPGLFIFLLFLTIVLVKKVVLIKRLLLFQMLLIYVLSISTTTHHLYALLETISPLTTQQIKTLDNDVIIILAGGIKARAKEYNRPDVGYFSLLRLRYGAWLQKQTGLPIIVTGGIERGGMTEAELMKQVLQQEFAVSGNIFVEGQSSNTLENAQFSQQIMAQQGFSKPLLVTSAFHMPRALLAFQQMGKTITAAPTGFQHSEIDYLPGDFIPNSNSLRENYLALHELIGFCWYKLRLQGISQPPAKQEAVKKAIK